MTTNDAEPAGIQVNRLREGGQAPAAHVSMGVERAVVCEYNPA